MNNENEQSTSSFGEVLRNTREKASYSIAYISSQTHLQPEIIEALEQERFDLLPGEVFVRGYIRTYTKLLGLEAQSVIDAYERVKPDKPQQTTTIIKPKKRRSTGVDPVVIWSTVTVATILIGLLVSWWTHHEAEPPVELASVAEQYEDPVALEEVNPISTNDTNHQVGLGDISPEIDSSLQTPNDVDISDHEVTQQHATT